MPTLTLDYILEHCKDGVLLHQNASIDAIDHITLDSRKTTATSLLVALCGQRVDGRQFIANSSAPLILVDQWSDDFEQQAQQWNKTVIQVSNARRSMAILAAELEQHPSKSMHMVGITGTNGKTTTTWMLSHILQYCQHSSMSTSKTLDNDQRKVGTIGTIGHRINGVPTAIQDGFTTPESPGLQRVLREFVNQGCHVCIMEVSSIGLMMHRVGGIKFDVTAFTNFTQDHLDIHGSMNAYLLEKRKLFTEHVHSNSTSILVVDQDEIAMTPVTEGQSIKVSTQANQTCDLWVSNPKYSLEGVDFIVHIHSKSHQSTTRQTHPAYVPLIGKHNVENAIVATSVARALGYSTTDILNALRSLPQAPGRLERISSPVGWHAFVDYAHTPDALLQSLSSLKPLCHGKLWVLFGCGGDRDARKRPEMGRIAVQESDCVIVTSDNPRSENPQTIVQHILNGIPVDCLKPVHSIVDRKEAIAWAIQQLHTEDVLLVAGKGHENYQIIQGIKHSFDDRKEIERFISKNH